MKLVEKIFNGDSRKTTWSIYPIGDTHVGALNCAEDKIRTLVKRIAADPNAYWVGGGDYCDAVVINDAKRFDPSVLPNWMLQGKDPDKVRNNLMDMLSAQEQRLYSLLAPIKDKCLGLIEGNHEYTIMKHHNRDFMKSLCAHFNAEELTDCAFMRLKFLRHSAADTTCGHVIRMFICHGHGGGRTSGAEPNNLYRLAADKEVDLVFKGHSHTYCIHPPIPMLTIPAGGKLPTDPDVYDKHAANWGAYLYTYKTGPSTYASRANYPVRPMYTAAAKLTPFMQTTHRRDIGGKIEMLAIKL